MTKLEELKIAAEKIHRFVPKTFWAVKSGPEKYENYYNGEYEEVFPGEWGLDSHYVVVKFKNGSRIPLPIIEGFCPIYGGAEFALPVIAQFLAEKLSSLLFRQALLPETEKVFPPPCGNYYDLNVVRNWRWVIENLFD